VVGLLRSVKKRNDVDRQVKALYSKAEWKSICKFAVPTPFFMQTCSSAISDKFEKNKKINGIRSPKTAVITPSYLASV